MKTVDPILRNQIRNGYDLTCVPKFIVQFEMNRYFATTVDNVLPDVTYNKDIDMFPVTTLSIPNRPSKGMNKARINESIISPGYIDSISPRFYITGVDDIYKYWQAPNMSSSTGTITGVQPYVIYNTSVTCNKLLIQFENTWASPNDWNVQVTTDGTTWTTVSTAPPLANDGTVSLYWNGSGWSTTKPATGTLTRTIKGMRVTVNSLKGGVKLDGTPTTYKKSVSSGGTVTTQTVTTDGKNAHFSMIGMGAWWEVDMSSRVITTDDTFDYGEASQVTPLGTVTSNTGTVSLWNGDHYLTNDNASSPYFGMIDSNARCNLSYVYDINDSYYEVQQFHMFSDVWSGQRTETVELSLMDESKMFNNLYPRPASFLDKTLPEIVYRICDSVGFSRYKIDVDSANLLTQLNIPVFWMDGEKTVWEVFDDLAEATQSSIFFDKDGYLRVRTREAAFDTNRPIDWKLLGTTTVDGLTDIVTLEQTEKYESNHIKVNYTPRTWSPFNNGFPALQTVWEPDGDLVVRCTKLIKDMGGTDATFAVTQADAQLWPYTSVVNIEGELIEYDAKEFVYYTGTLGTTANTVWCLTADDYTKYNALSDDAFKFKNTFTGNFRVKVNKDGSQQRGIWNTSVSPHITSTYQDGYYTNHAMWNRIQYTTNDGFIWDEPNSRVSMHTSGNWKTEEDVQLFTHGADTDGNIPIYYGTSIKLDSNSNYSTGTAGIVICNSSSGGVEDGYYIQIKATDAIGDDDREVEDEIAIYVNSGANFYQIATVPMAIVRDVSYEMDVMWSNGVFQVWIDGQIAMIAGVPNDLRIRQTGKFGVFIKGLSAAHFDYLYAVVNPIDELPDDFGFYDRINGGYMGQAFERRWTFQIGFQGRVVQTDSNLYQTLYGGQFYDEFGPLVHEVRQFDVKFDPSPVLHSRLYSSNDSKSACVLYRSTPFGAHFVVANVARTDAILNGDDASNGGDDTVNQVFSVIGRALVEGTEAKIEIKNVDQMRIRGDISSDLTNDWIQTAAFAQQLADWITAHWSTGLDEQAVTIFGNPLIELGDVVEVYYPQKNINHVKYFVTSVKNTFEQGIATSLVLRKVAV